MLVLALVLRLASTGPAPADAAANFAASFGEHALCLAAAAGGDAGPARPVGDPPAPPGGHAGHDDATCCQLHAAGGTILPTTGAIAPIAFATPADRFIEAETATPGRSIARARARGPPPAMG